MSTTKSSNTTEISTTPATSTSGTSSMSSIDSESTSSDLGPSSSNTTTSSGQTAAEKSKLYASSAYDSIKKNVSVAADATTRNLAKLQGRPTTITCSNTTCSKTLAIPPSVWTWKCTLGHENGHANNECDTCHETKLNALGNTISWPALLCQNCGTVTAVPHSELENSLYTGAYLIRHSFHEMTDTPKTFHCQSCNTLLLVPQGPWVCQTCTSQNYPAVSACSKCSQSKSAQKVICGHCHKSTGVPGSGLLDNISSAIKQLASVTTKAYMDVTGQQNIPCPTCKHPIKIPASFTPIPVQPVEAKHPEESKQTSQTSALIQPGQSWSLTLRCDNCHNSFQLLKQGKGKPTDLTDSANAAIETGSTLPVTSTSSATSENREGREGDMNAFRHQVWTSDGQQVADYAPAPETDSSTTPSTLYNASNLPPTAGATSAGPHTMPASSTTTTSSSTTGKNL